MPVFDTRSIPWKEPPGHVGGFSKHLVNEEASGSRYFDFRLSRYPIRGRVDPHTHRLAEQVYYFIDGTGVALCGDEKHLVGPGFAMFVPPGTLHAVENTGDRDLVFVIATSPPSDDAPR